MRNNSPWLHQVRRTRDVRTLQEDLETDVVVVGGGIAGVSTAFFILRDTTKSLVLVEGGRVGHGATGHNAGQLTTYFARSLESLVEEFGLEKTIEAQKNVEVDAWECLDMMYTESRLDMPLSKFIGHLGISNKKHLLSILKDNAIRKSGGLPPKEILVADHVEFLAEIEKDFSGLFKLVPHDEILTRLETGRREFVACLSEQKGCTNSALLVERVIEYLLETYSERFQVLEHTHVNKIVLHENSSILDVGSNTIRSERVILATNGFGTLKIFDQSGLEIDTRFHHYIQGKIGYMSGYLEDFNKPPTAISYFTDPDASQDDPYFYLTRRPFEYDHFKHNLISIGGPEINLEDKGVYEMDHEYPERAKDEIDSFVHSIYKRELGDKIDYVFTWHGLMGYTKSRLRLVGAEPRNPVLLYNLGCNGVGILPSVFGARRLAGILNGENIKPSIFDPARMDSYV